MKGGISKLLLLSNRSNSTIRSRVAIPPPTIAILRRHLSSHPRTPAARGARRRETRDEFDDDFEELFLHTDPNATSPRKGGPRRASDHGENDNVSSGRNRDGANPERHTLEEEGLDLGSFGVGARKEGLDREIAFDDGADDGKITIYRAGPYGAIPERRSLEEILGRRSSSGARTAVKGAKRSHRKRDKGITLAKKSWFAHIKGEDAKEEEEMDVILSRLRRTRLIPYAAAMLDGLWKDGLIQEAMKLFGLLREKWTIPEVVIYTAVVDGFLEAGKFDDAKRTFSKMKKNGIVPNAFTYGVVVQGLCRGKRWNDSVEFTMEMLASNHSPNLTTLTALIHGIRDDKGVDEAEKLVRRLKEAGLAAVDRFPVNRFPSTQP